MEHKRASYDLLDVPEFQEDDADDMRPSRGMVISAVIGGVMWAMFAIAVLFATGVLE